MTPPLALLDAVRWHDRDVVGDRPRVLLASLAEARGATVGDTTLIDELWPEEAPADPHKALQVVVSRTRRITGTDAVVRAESGYRLTLSSEEIDALAVLERAHEAARAMGRGDWAEARDIATALAGTTVGAEADGPLGRLRTEAARALREAARIRALSLSALGQHEAAAPLLEAEYALDHDDERVLAALLRSLAAEQGPPAALERYERYRRELAERLGTDPAEALRRLHAELLAADRPVRDGLLYDGTSLIGRDTDVARLRELLHVSRVTTILGAGGLGKTRLAHILGHGAEQPVVHFIELVGVVAEAGLLPTLGAALGIRETSGGAGTRGLDLRARIAENLGSAPTLLILDNCEQIIGAVADLVATLVANTRDLTVLTTSRSPLGIRAEQVYTLAELSPADAVTLFGERARAARPGVMLDDATVDQLVRRLDGLPLAIELAAARVRAMSVRDVLDRLDRRFALLRGGSTAAPERHQTLLAVIDWSWNLLDDGERTALRRLAVFHDGFTLDAAGRLLGEDAVAVVESLVEHSLLTVHEDTGIRYRMLETVREFGRDRLAESGESDAALAALRGWAVGYGREFQERLIGPGQVEAVDALRAEEANLSNELRVALDASDAPAVLALAASLMRYWEITDGYRRLLVYLDRVAPLMTAYEETPAERHAMRRVLSAIVLAAAMRDDGATHPATLKLTALGPGDDPQLAGDVHAVLALVMASDENALTVLTRLSEEADLHTRLRALRWLAHLRENSGDLDGALRAASSAVDLCPDTDGPWLPATMRAFRSQLLMQLGRRREAVLDAELAIGPLSRLYAEDDVARLRLNIAIAHVADGRVDRAEAVIDELADTGHGLFGGAAGAEGIRAEIAARRGDGDEARRLMRRGLAVNRSVTVPGRRELSGFEPWSLVALSLCVVTCARFGTPDDDLDLVHEAAERLSALLARGRTRIDVPVLGCLVFSLGLWGLAQGGLARDTAVRLLVLARRFGYNQGHPSMDWSVAEELAARNTPGRLAEQLAADRDRPIGDLFDELTAVAQTLRL